MNERDTTMTARLRVTEHAVIEAPWRLRQRAQDAIESARADGVVIVERDLFPEFAAEFLMRGDPVAMAPAIEALRAVINYVDDEPLFARHRLEAPGPTAVTSGTATARPRGEVGP